ncbi:MAG TPA: hypothetical protein VK607_07805 [Kofleriaceae bacterium]|nr:hypothetical protein [Kofleriaceae bacterium]
MTATTTPPPAPAVALTIDQTTRLLDRMVHDHVMSCIDLDALYRVEQALAVFAADLGGIDPARATALAEALVDRSLQRLPADLRSHLRSADWPLFDVDRCKEDPRRPGRTGPGGAATRVAAATRVVRPGPAATPYAARLKG